MTAKEGRHYIGVKAPWIETFEYVWLRVGIYMGYAFATLYGVLSWIGLMHSHPTGAKLILLAATLYFGELFALMSSFQFSKDHVEVLKVTDENGNIGEDTATEGDHQLLYLRGYQYASWFVLLGTASLAIWMFANPAAVVCKLSPVVMLAAFLAPGLHHMCANAIGLRSRIKGYIFTARLPTKSPPPGRPSSTVSSGAPQDETGSGAAAPVASKLVSRRKFLQQLVAFAAASGMNTALPLKLLNAADDESSDSDVDPETLHTMPYNTLQIRTAAGKGLKEALDRDFGMVVPNLGLGDGF